MEGLSLSGSLAGSCLARFLIQPRTACLGNGIAHSGLDPPVSPDMFTGQSDLGHSSTETQAALWCHTDKQS